VGSLQARGSPQACVSDVVSQRGPSCRRAARTHVAPFTLGTQTRLTSSSSSPVLRTPLALTGLGRGVPSHQRPLVAVSANTTRGPLATRPCPLRMVDEYGWPAGVVRELGRNPSE
jgi:hypothetical protein